MQRTYAGTLVVRAGRVSYGHDRQGRVVARSRKRLSRRPETWQFSYDAEDRMVAATSGAQHWSYSYDAFGRRVSKQRLGGDGEVLQQTLFAWDGNRLIEQTSVRGGASTTTWEYAPGGWDPISQTVGGSDLDARFYAVVSDLIGTPTELVTPDGSRVAWSNADASVWGDARRKAADGAGGDGPDGVDCPLRFSGQYADDETGLHYNRYRYYDPAAARYTTADPLGLAPGPDPYGYVRNPTGWADPLGLTPCSAGAGGVDDGPGSLAPTGRIDPTTVRFSQNSIRSTFKSGGSVEKLADDLRSGVVDPLAIPPIRILERGGLIHTLDNRRLAAFQQAGIDIPYRLATRQEIVNDYRKFSTKNGGVSIEVRKPK